MKKITSLLLVFVIVSLSMTVYAQKMTKKQAEKAAITYLESQGKADLTLQNIRSVDVDNQAMLYILNFEPSSFVLLSTEKQVEAILAYSLENTAPESLVNPAFNEWAYSYSHQVKEIVDLGIKNSDAEAQWNSLLDGTFVSQEGKSVNPLLNTTWDQGQYYNADCPSASGGPGGHVWAGCVATALGQVMKYHAHPEQGNSYHSYNHPTYGFQEANFGETTYDWAGMPNSIYTYDSDVAELLYHCAVSVDMDFGVSGSGASPYDVVPAVKNYFGYNLGTSIKSKDSYDYQEWINMMKEEMDASRPSFCGGYNSSQTEGHAYVCDGYNNSNKFHFNWGWSGYYNGYFSLNNLNPGGSNFSYGQQAIFYMEPAGEAFAYLGLESNLAFINPNPLETGQSMVLPSQVTNTGVIAFDGCVYLSLYDLEGEFVGDIDSKEIMVNPNGNKTVVFTNSELPYPVGSYELRLYYQQGCSGDLLLVEDGSYENNYPIDIIYPVGVSSELSEKEIQVFPNPMENILKIETSLSGDLRVRIMDASGKQVLEQKLNTAIESVDVSSLSKGSYILQIQSGEGNYHRLLIK